MHEMEGTYQKLIAKGTKLCRRRESIQNNHSLRSEVNLILNEPS